MSYSNLDFDPTSPLKDTASVPRDDEYEQGSHVTFDSFRNTEVGEEIITRDETFRPYPYQEYTDQQRNEMNMFSANANFTDDEDLLTDSQTEKISDEDAQRHEINMFVAYANADFGEGMILDDVDFRKDAQDNEADNMHTDLRGSNAVETEEDADRQRREMTAFAAFANSDLDDEISIQQDRMEEEERRHREMNMFSVYANADVGENDSWNTFSPSRADAKPSSTITTSKINSGTFVLGSQSSTAQDGVHTSSDSTNKNLSAALASLTCDADSIDTKDQSDSSNTNTMYSFPTHQRKPKHTDPYTACVLAQKPLFFGNLIPESVQKVLEKESCSTDEPSKGYKLLRSAVETYGNLSLGPFHNLSIERDEKSSYVKLFEPVWGNESRLKREDRIAKAYKENLSNHEVSFTTIENNVSERQDTKVDLNKDTVSNHSETMTSKELSIGNYEKVVTPNSAGETNVHQNNREREKLDLNSNLFLKYARGEATGGTLISVPDTRVLNSDPNGSFEGNELKKEVGLNDNLTKALESLSTSDSMPSTNMSLSAMEAGEAAAAAIESLKVSANYGRPLSNYEITQGKVPLYACDDEPLPSLSDLGKFETREDQHRFNKKCESQEIIASQTVPNIFGGLICPSPALGPQDSQSWLIRYDDDDELIHNSANESEFLPLFHQSGSRRKSLSLDTRTMHLSKKTGSIPSPLPPPPIKMLQSRHQTLPLPNRHDNDSASSSLKMEKVDFTNRDTPTERKGWWNFSTAKMKTSKRRKNKLNRHSNADSFLQRPWRESKRPDDYSSLICPQSESLIELNRSLSDLNPAVESIKHLPLLSDRCPSTRFVQIDTQVVGFPSIGEIEPLFCSMSLWHVQSNDDKDFGQNSDTYCKCGKITESLKFDMVNEAEIEEIYKAPLYFPSPSEEHHLSDLRTTSCGIFPIPAIYELSQIHAVLIVHKVLGDETDLDVYWNLDSTSSSDQRHLEASKVRERASKRPWHFLTPFAFGVVPLVQIISSDAPTSPTSRACQIPLFKYKAGDDPNQVIDHILAMSYTSNHKKPADLTNGGKAMLVIRDFGYMGPHASLSSKSKFARDRLVDFTGEVQVRKRGHDEMVTKIDSEGGKIEVMNGWHDEFCIEPAQNGGRNYVSHQNRTELIDYCQELAQLPIHVSNETIPKSLRSAIGFYTSFSNELLLIPISLEKCSRRNITIKIEVMRVKSSENESGYIATPLAPCIHNSRRGPFLVNQTYTNAAYHKENPLFLDEIKIKLPLEPLTGDADGQVVILFTLFHVAVNSKKKWSLNGGNAEGQPSFMSQIGCGYFPLSTETEISSLRPNGMYPVEIKYRSVPYQDSKTGTVLLEPLFVTTTRSHDRLMERMNFDEHFDKNVEINQQPSTDTSSCFDYSTLESFDAEGRVFDHLMLKSGLFKDFKSKAHIPNPAVLNVRLVSLSSVHPQNTTLSKFFIEMPSVSHVFRDSDFEGEWKAKKAGLLEEINCIRHDKKPEQCEQEIRLQNILVELSKSSFCPHTELTKHFLRILPELWRLLVAGTGKPSITFANPANIDALRLSAFSTLLYVINSVSMYMYKNEKLEADGVTRWNMSTMSKIVGMLFDEDNLFLYDEETMEDEESLSNDLDRSEHFSSSNPSEPSPAFPNINESFSKVGTSPEKCASSTCLNTRDDLVLLNSSDRPASLRIRSFSAPQVKPFKIDTKTDFQQALNAANSPLSSLAGLGSVSIGPAATRRKWLGGPSSSLATIAENSDNLESADDKKIPKLTAREMIFDSLDSELVIRNDVDPSKLKQMRVPQRVADTENVDLNDEDANSIESMQSSVKTVPNMDEIEAAGEAFLDVVGKTLGISPPQREKIDEDRRVGVSHHRKTKSRCSIDWTLPPTDQFLENHQQLEVVNHVSSDLSKSNASSFESIGDVDVARSEGRQNDFKKNANEVHFINPKDKFLYLPSYVERMRYHKSSKQGRWFPYMYEVIVFQWTAILSEQRRRGLKSSKDGNASHYSHEPLLEASQKTFGYTVSCAPVLFSVIKKSLASRIHSLLRRQECSTNTQNQKTFACAHSLLSLDDALMGSLEELVTMLTDACIDSRNFDSWSFRNTSILVNDAIIYFLLDLFALINHKMVHRLVLTYFSRFICKDGKQWQDRDSKIGLRCSWEVTKLRLNAVTAFVRFADFLHVNKSVVEKWGSWAFRPPSSENRHLYLQAIDELDDLSMSDFATSAASRKSYLVIPDWKPHWLVELVMDICLDASGHVEQSIQLRAASLLYELVWSSNIVGRVDGCLTAAASLYISFVSKILGQIEYLSTLPAKCHLRAHLLPCVVFVLQSAPFGILRALYGKLCKEVDGRKYNGGFDAKFDENEENPSILDLLSLLNLILATLEYDGDEYNAHFVKEGSAKRWRSEYLLGPEHDLSTMSKLDPKRSTGMSLTSTSSRKWLSHDASVIVISTCRNIIREYLSLQKPTSCNPLDSDSCLDRDSSLNQYGPKSDFIEFTLEEKTLFVRAISSVYLTSLTLRESDIVLIKTLVASVEIVKVFGIKLFMQSIGETLQHWMRLILFHCGARRSKVRVEALEFLALILRLQWDTFGTFTRIRIPLLAVQTEVMERIIAKAAYKYDHVQNSSKSTPYFLSTHEVEAALTPLWRTLHRLHHSSASNNAAFKSALQLLAYRMKTLYKAYLAAYTLASANRGSASGVLNEKIFHTLRVLMESAEFSKEITGNNQTTLRGETVTIHYEVVEDALLAAANVFLPTELPIHRVAWLRKLAEFHSFRNKYAEEASCRLQIYKTLQEAAALHGSLWNSSPFLPWTNDHESLSAIDTFSNSLAQNDRRLFYRSQNSVRVDTGDWGVGGKKPLFNGVTFASEYDRNISWISLREIESEMVQEAEEAGDLFLRAGIIESSRYCWSLATKYHMKVFNYARLAMCYKKLAHVVASQVPTIDTSSQLELSSPLGRFYRVYFHGGASGNLMGREFVYRADVSVKLEAFCKYLQNILLSILPEKTPIELVLDDGRAQEIQKGKILPKRQFGAVPREQMIVKITPLNPVLVQDRCTIGSSEWFYRQIQAKEFQNSGHRQIGTNTIPNTFDGVHAYSKLSSFNSGVSSFGRPLESYQSFSPPEQSDQDDGASSVKRFSFSQPRDRSKGSRDLLKGVDGDVTEKSLRVTELLLSESMPNCVSRQPVSVEHRSVFNQSPLEASVEAVCGWCAVLFRTSVATHGASILGTNSEQGIGKAAVKVIADCIHHSRVKEIGLVMLDTTLSENPNENHSHSIYEKLSRNEVKDYQIKLSRAIVILMELLHVLIGKNRDLLLSVSKMNLGDHRGDHSFGHPPSPGCYSDCYNEQSYFFQDKIFDDGSGTYGESTVGTMGTMDRTDKAKALQRELQIAFISMIKTLHPLIYSQIHGETPQWMNLCIQDNYFSSGLYRQARIAIGDELLFFERSHSEFKSAASYTEERSGIPISILPPRSVSDQDHESYSERSVTSRTHTSRESFAEFQQSSQM